MIHTQFIMSCRTGSSYATAITMVSIITKYLYTIVVRYNNHIYILLAHLSRCHLGYSWPTGPIDAPFCCQTCNLSNVTKKYAKTTTKRQILTLNLLKYMCNNYTWLIKNYHFIYLKVKNTFFVKKPTQQVHNTSMHSISHYLSLIFSCYLTLPPLSDSALTLLCELWKRKLIV